MLNDEQFAKFLQGFPALNSADKSALQAIQREAFYANLKAGQDIFFPGDDVNALALLLNGTVRVYKAGESGREITLYRFASGESCILTANAILNNQLFSAIATAEDDIEAIMIPADSFRKWVTSYDIWRNFLYQLLSERLSAVLQIVDEVTFGRMDVRVANFLRERTQSENPLHITHQDIADELGSSREVISRLLGSMANAGAIQLGRGTIEVIDKPILENLALM